MSFEESAVAQATDADTHIIDEVFYGDADIEQSTVGELVAEYRAELEDFKNSEEYTEDPVMPHLVGQLDNHLKHVSYSFRVAGNVDDYPFDPPRETAFPADHTEIAIERVDRLRMLLDAEIPTDVSDYGFTVDMGKEAMEMQSKVVHNLLDNPLETYEDYTARRERDGFNASFPEIGWTIKALASDMVNKQEVADACEKSPMLAKLRVVMLEYLAESIDDDVYKYRDSLDLVEDTMSFFDLVERVNDPASPPPYHSDRFEYNWHSLRDDPDHTILPSMTPLGLPDLIKLRGVQVGLVGVCTKTVTVDGFPQTPYEFFHHDVDHTRRMHQETVAAIEREGITAHQYAVRSTELMQQLLPLIDIDSKYPDKGDLSPEQQDDYDQMVARLLVLFEVLHEDAYDCSRDSIADAILRAPMDRTPFERVVTEDGKEIIEFYTGPRASLLAHVYRKLAHSFYDMPGNRSTALGSDFARTRQNIVQAASELYRVVSDDPISDEDLITTCRDLVSTDEGFTDAFLGNLIHDIRRRSAGREMLRLTVSRPLSVNAAIRKIHRTFEDRQLHSLFGYSGLEYENPELLEETVLEDLEHMDRDNVAIAIGATPYGIGRLYPAIKKAGFLTLGIVSSTAVAQGEESAEGVDELFVVKDTNWGGYRWDTGKHGLLTPTTRVFVGASDSIGAYGGGNITAVSIGEMLSRGKPVTYRPFDMNHNIADMLAAQHGNDKSQDYRGPAFHAWNKLQNS